MVQAYICPLGCLLRVSSKKDIDEHNGQHLTNIKTLFQYRFDLVSPDRAVLYQQIMALIEEWMEKVPDLLPVDFQQVPTTVTINLNSGSMRFT